MNRLMKLALPLVAATSLGLSTMAYADAVTHSVVGVGGYDLTTYFSSEKPARGNGHHVVMLDGVNYLFTTDENKKKFEANPERYLPAYGGYCAYGASIGKKFVADPDVYDIVDGKLYLNLDSKIRGIWSGDIKGNIRKADGNWKEIVKKKPSEL